MDKAVYDEMFELERAHWWFAAKRRIVLSMLERFTPRSGGLRPRVCDIGCGCGMMLCDLAGAGYDAVGMDFNDLALEYCQSRGVSAVKGSLPNGVALGPASADAILLLDVLEHIDDDVAAFSAAFAAVKPGGIAICMVPAYQWLWTKRDEYHHHKRRYTLGQFRRVVAHPQAGIDCISYVNSFLFPLALVERLVRKVAPESTPAGHHPIPPLGINSLMTAVFAAERWPVRAGVQLPFGLSILTVVRKRA